MNDITTVTADPLPPGTTPPSPTNYVPVDPALLAEWRRDTDARIEALDAANDRAASDRRAADARVAAFLAAPVLVAPEPTRTVIAALMVAMAGNKSITPAAAAKRAADMLAQIDQRWPAQV
jgi:hypothetical protein